MKPGIVAFAFGTPATIFSNRRLAEIATGWAKELEAPVYTQRDISLGGDVEFEYAEETFEPPPTLRMAREAVHWAVTRGIGELYVVAATPHRDRCLRDLRVAADEAGVEIGIFGCLPTPEEYVEDAWFCLDSADPSTRSARAWWRRERVVRLMPLSLYKRVAS